MYNKFVIIGFMTKDPEMRHTPQGTAVTNITVASNYKYGEHKETLFIDCVIWGKQAEFVSKYLIKGNLVLAEGRIVERTWQDNLGGTRKKMELNVVDIKSLSKKEGTTVADTKEGIGAPETDDLEPF